MRNRRKSGVGMEWRMGREESGQKDSEGLEWSVEVFVSRSNGPATDRQGKGKG